MENINVGDKFKFFSTAADRGSPGYPERSGQKVEIVRELGDSERDLKEVGRMFVVQFSDGIECNVFLDELFPL